MKEILKPYLGTGIRIDESYASMNYEYKLVKVEDSYFGIINNINDPTYRYIPYSSISEISERKKILTIKICNSDQFMELLDNIHLTMIDDIETKLDSLIEELEALKEKTNNVSMNTISLNAPLGELIRSCTDIKEKMNEINKEAKNTNNSISSLESTVRYNSRIL